MAFPASQSRPAPAERRRDARLEYRRPLKAQCAMTGRYFRGRTGNLSAGGALLELDHPSLLVPGQRLRVGIAWTDQTALLSTPDLMEATVVRSLGIGGSQRVAIAFDERLPLAVAV